MNATITREAHINTRFTESSACAALQQNKSQICVYHGSPYLFSQFRASNSGIHFGTHDQAVHAATLRLARLPADIFASLEEVKGWRGKVCECVLELENIKRISDPRTPQAWSRQIKNAIAQGFDSIVYRNDFEGSVEADSYCVFSTENILSIKWLD